MDFDFSPDQIAFRDQVERFLDENDDPIVFDVTRENMAQIVDTPKRREFMATLGEKGWLGITWPKEWGGQEGDGVYEYLLNEALARRGVEGRAGVERRRARSAERRRRHQLTAEPASLWHR